MDRSEIQDKLIELVKFYMSSLGNSPEGISSESNPIKDFQGFDSLVGVLVTVGALGEFGIKEGKDIGFENLFTSKDGQNPISINESVDRIEELIR